MLHSPLPQVETLNFRASTALDDGSEASPGIEDKDREEADGCSFDCFGESPGEEAVDSVDGLEYGDGD